VGEQDWDLAQLVAATLPGAAAVGDRRPGVERKPVADRPRGAAGAEDDGCGKLHGEEPVDERPAVREERRELGRSLGDCTPPQSTRTSVRAGARAFASCRRTLGSIRRGR
jgi:hypothetical protein